MQRGNKKPDSYHPMSPKLLKSFVMAVVAVPSIVLSYCILLAQRTRQSGRRCAYQRDEEDSQGYRQHGWYDARKSARA